MSITAPAYLAPTWRYANDAWNGSNALIYVVWATAPVYAADGVTIVTAGVPQNLTGFTVDGTLRWQCPGTTTALPSPIGTVNDPVNGIVSLSISAAQSALPRQSLALWSSSAPDPTRALLLVQPRILDANGNPVTIGLQPLFVF